MPPHTTHNNSQLLANASSGVGLALDEAINAGFNFDISVYDTQCALDKSEKAMREALDEGVNAVIGDVCSGASLADLPLANAAMVPLISPTATSPQLTTPDFFFRSVFHSLSHRH